MLDFNTFLCWQRKMLTITNKSIAIAIKTETISYNVNQNCRLYILITFPVTSGYSNYVLSFRKMKKPLHKHNLHLVWMTGNIILFLWSAWVVWGLRYLFKLQLKPQYYQHEMWISGLSFNHYVIGYSIYFYFFNYVICILNNKIVLKTSMLEYYLQSCFLKIPTEWVACYKWLCCDKAALFAYNIL